MIRIYFVLFLLISCGSTKKKTNTNKISSNKTYLYNDPSGTYFYKREAKRTKGLVVTRTQLLPNRGNLMVLEKTTSLSKVKKFSAKSKGIIPYRSQHQIWFDKKKYSSDIKILVKKKKIEVTLDSPEKRWQGTKSFDLPGTNVLCFYTQIPECLKSYGILDYFRESKIQQLPFVLIWDIYPYHQDQLVNISDNIVENVMIKLDSVEKDLLKLSLDLSNQIIFYQFDNGNYLKNMFWVSQGLNVKGVN